MKKAIIKIVEDRLSKDEGAWLKSLGEIGDLARLLYALQASVKKLTERIDRLEKGQHHAR